VGDRESLGMLARGVWWRNHRAVLFFGDSDVGGDDGGSGVMCWLLILILLLLILILLSLNYFIVKSK